MFIDITRPGAEAVVLRLAAGAIGYLTRHPSGAVIRLIGGESLLVNETVDEIEERVASLLSLSFAPAETLSADLSPPPGAEPAAAAPVEPAPVEAAPAEVVAAPAQPEPKPAKAAPKHRAKKA